MRKLLVLPAALLFAAVLASCNGFGFEVEAPSVFSVFVDQPSDTTAPAQITVNITTAGGWEDVPDGSVTLHVTASGGGGQETKLITSSQRFLDAPYKTFLHFVFNSGRDPTLILVHIKAASGKSAEARCTPPTTTTVWNCS